MLCCLCCKELGQARCRLFKRLTKNNPRRRGDNSAESSTQEVAASTEYPPWNIADMDSLPRGTDVRDFLETFELSQNENYVINPSVRSVRMGLSWNKGIDVDASVALFDESLRVEDTVWRRRPRSGCHTVTHSGCDMTRIGEGDDEVINVDLANLPIHVHYLLFVICIISHGVSFRQSHSAYVRMMHGKERYKNRQLCCFSLTDMSGHAMMVGVLTRKGPYWSFRTLGIPATGRTIRKLLQNRRNLECLNANPSHAPELRRLTVQVIKATGLVAVDTAGCSEHASSDLYFIITFKDKTYTSERRRHTLEPEWESHPFEMGWINEVETKALKVHILNYHAVEKDDFMGMIRIRGRRLYRLGWGDHTFWFKLENSKEKSYKHEDVSGRVLIRFRIYGSASSLHPSHHSSMKPDEIVRDPQSSGARDSIENREGETSVDHEERQTVVDANPERSIETEDSQGTSDGEYSSSSDGIWNPDEPFGSRGRLLKEVAALERNIYFADDYVMDVANFAGKPHLRLAKQRFGKRNFVVLKFYWEETTLDHAIEMHAKVTTSDHVCRIVQTLKASKTRLPPCIVFEKGNQTLRDWLLENRPMFDRRWCMCQILTGLMEIHAEGVVHCDLKPSNVVFFPNVRWKIIDFDKAQKAGESRAACFTAPYAAPEVLRGWQEEGELPVAQPSSDMWSCGILAYEVLTGARMFDHDLTLGEIYDSILDGRVEAKLGLIANEDQREAISKFLKLDPVERWSAADALQHLVFQSDPHTTCTPA